MNKSIVTFSFLATINNGNHYIDNIVKVYEPLVKYVLSLMYKNKMHNFILNDFVEEFRRVSGVNIPIPLIDEILKSLSTNNIIHYSKDKAILIRKYSFEEYLETYEENVTDLHIIEEDFRIFCMENGYDDDINFYDFVNLYCNQIISFTEEIKTNTELQKEQEVYYRYLTEIEKDFQKKATIKKIFWGMLVTFYVCEKGVDNKLFYNFQILIDTSFFISLIGYHNDTSNEIAQSVYDIATKFGIKFYIFDQTVEEIKNLLSDTALKLKSYVNLSEIYDNDITIATFRNPNISSTDLELAAVNIQLTLKKYNIKVEYIERFKHKVQNSDLYKYFIEKIHKDEISAFHDTAAIEYVKNCRKGAIKNIESAKCWFIQDRKNNTNRLYNKLGTINEKISSHDMLLILWLSKPTGLDLDKLAEIEFMKLITIANEEFIPNRALLKEFEDNLNKYSQNSLSEEEIAAIYLITSNKTSVEIDKMNKSNDEEFNKGIKQWLEKFSEEKDELKASYDSTLNSINKEVLLYKSLYNEEHGKRIFVNNEIDDISEKNKSIKKELVDAKTELLDGKKSKLLDIEEIEKRSRNDIERKTLKFIYGVEIVLSSCAIIVYLKLYYQNFSKIEPILSIPFVFVLNRIVKFFNISKSIEEIIVTRRLIKFDALNKDKYYEKVKLSNEIDSLEKEIILLQGE